MKKLFFSFILAGSFMQTNAQITTLFTCANDTNGREPNCTLVSDGTYLYGTTRIGGDNGMGMIFKIKPDGTGYEDIYDYAMPITGGYDPRGSLIIEGSYLYGMTFNGGANDMGTIYKIMTDGTGYVKLLDFDGTNNGKDPRGALVSDGTFLYGMTSAGGMNDKGTIFKIMPDGSGYVKLLDFDGTSNGGDPWGSLIYDVTYLYGMTHAGGVSNMGVIFKIKPDGTGYDNLMDLTNTSGGVPTNSLYYDGTFLYGLTVMGGANSMGTLIKIQPDGTGFVKLLDFAGASNGSYPQCDLTMADGFLYGMTTQGGTNSMGTIFKILPDGTGYLKLTDFTGSANGSLPLGGLYSDGISFYGTTSAGGVNTLGTVFKFQYSFAGIENNNQDFSMNVYPNPTSGELHIVVKNKADNVKLEIINMVGQPVMSVNNIHLLPGENYKIDISALTNGTYLLQFDNCKKVIVKK